MRILCPVIFWAVALLFAVSASALPRCVPMVLPVAFVGPPPDAYGVFCSQHQSACALSGESVLAWSDADHAAAEAVNAQVNQEIAFVSDWELNGEQDVWDYPSNCQGDCEDLALEKRRRLVDAGVPSAALTMAIGFHEVRFFPHAVLLLETTKGTWVFDNLYDSLMCWDAVPYVFTHRERPDGQWDRYRLP